jgi:uncharacterized coiled-coil DUF342 family protein
MEVVPMDDALGNKIISMLEKQQAVLELHGAKLAEHDDMFREMMAKIDLNHHLLMAELRGHKNEMYDKFAELKTEFTGLKTEFAELKTEFAGLKTEFAELKTEFAGLKSEVDEMKENTGTRFDRLEQSALDIKHILGEQQIDVRQLDRRMRWLERDHTLLEERVDRLEKTR